MTNIFTEENGYYALDCRAALWASDSMHEEYGKTGNFLNDVDFIIEDEDYIYLVEYKNATIPGAVNPDGFQPMSDKKIQNVCREFYDALHYLTILGKDKPKKYIYVLEYPNGDSASRRLLRNRIKLLLPFQLQLGGNKLIESVEVLSVSEWNASERYGNYPFCNVAELS